MTPAMRIAVVTETWPPDVNGVASTVARTVDGLRRRGHEVQLVTLQADGAGGAEAVAAGGPELRLPGMPIPRYPHLRMGRPAARRLRAAWGAWRPDVVHVATEGPLGHSALRAAKSLRLPVTSDFRTNFDAYCGHYGLGLLRGLVTGYLRRMHNAAACTMVPTETLKQTLAQRGFRNLHVVARGVDAQRFSPTHRCAELRGRWGAPDDRPVMLYVGRLAAEKNLSVLFDAWAAARSRHPSTRLVLVGDGPMRGAIEAAHPGAVLAGPRTGLDLSAHYASADLFVFPSQTETWGNVTGEAMASGLPVVAFRHAAAAQLIRHGEDGLLAPCDRPDRFVAEVAALVADPARARRLGALARARVLPLDWASIVEQVEGHLRQAVAGQPAAPAAAVLNPAPGSCRPQGLA